MPESPKHDWEEIEERFDMYGAVDEYLFPEDTDDDELQETCGRKTGIAYRRHMRVQKKKKRMAIMTYGYNPTVGYTDWGYQNGVYQPGGNHIKYPKNSKAQAFWKRLSNKRVRRAEVQSGGAYKKFLDYLWMLY